MEVCNDLRTQVDEFLINCKYLLVHKVTEFKNEFELISSKVKSEINASTKKPEAKIAFKTKEDLLKEAQKYLKPLQKEAEIRKTWSEKSPLQINDVSFMYDKVEVPERPRVCYTTCSADKPFLKKDYIFLPEKLLGARKTKTKHRRSTSVVDPAVFKEEPLNKTFSGRPELKVNISYHPESRFINQNFTVKSHSKERETSIKEDIVSIKHRLHEMIVNRMNSSMKTDLLMTCIAGQNLSASNYAASRQPQPRFASPFSVHK